ncbi:hypothetical protein AAZX31_02G057500 [Glycine max]|uniref:Uncharacterized protein n=1 Tax=Glycine soja TaxID=3848 RepID=A0A445LKJ3_GLYSO|nr:hypothetical protein D0Y65_003112 [Glycine soja]
MAYLAAVAVLRDRFCAVNCIHPYLFLCVWETKKQTKGDYNLTKATPEASEKSIYASSMLNKIRKLQRKMKLKSLYCK